MTPNDSRLLNEYKSKIDVYRKLEEVAAEKIKSVLQENSFFVMDISHRTKLPESLKGKLERKNGKYKELTDITDLCGMRIVSYFSDTVDEISNTLATVFTIDLDKSIDKREALQATQFGYLSLHCICTLPDDGTYDKDIVNIPFEIQIRTVLQHAWAEIEHNLGYKSEFGVPRPIRREFSRVAGLLEIADRQFVDLRKNSDTYNAKIREKIANNDSDSVVLDHVSLQVYMHINSRVLEFRNKLQEELGVETEDIDLVKILNRLEALEIDTVGDLGRAFDKYFDDLFARIKTQILEFELDIISTGMIIRNLCDYIMKDKAMDMTAKKNENA